MDNLTPREIADNLWTATLRELNTRKDLSRQTIAMIANDYCSFGHQKFDSLDGFIAAYYPAYAPE